MKAYWKQSGILLLCICLLIMLPINAFAGVDVRIEKGVIKFFTQDPEATTGIRYVTTGWIIQSTPKCTSGKTHCNPNTGDYGLIQSNHMVEKSRTVNNGIVTTSFEVGVQDVQNALKEAGLEAIAPGEPLYLNGIFQVSINGKLQTDHYYTLDEIKDAEPWSDTSAFEQYYDIRAKWDPPPGPQVTGFIDGDSQVADTVTVVNATYSFQAKSTSDQNLARYQIIDTQNCSFVNASDKSGTLHGLSDGKVDLPIKINIGTNPNIKASITIKVWDVNDLSAQHLAEKSVIKNTPPPPAQDSGDSDLEPNSQGKIGADPYATEKFDVVQGVPTHESLYTQAGGKRYLYDYHYQQVTGQKPYPISVKKTFNLSWQEALSSTDENGNSITTWVSKTESQTVTQNYTIMRNYSYWVVNKLQIYSIDHAEMFNYALPNGKSTMTPQNYTAPSVNATHSDALPAHVTDPTYDKMLDLGSESVPGGQGTKPSLPTEDWLADADSKVGKIKVKNDKFTFDGQTLMSDAQVEETAPDPTAVPATKQYDDDDHILYLSGQVISTALPNKANTPGTGKIYYKITGSTVNSTASQQVDDISGINTVTVHTPTVCYCDVSDDRPHNQMTVPDPSRRSLILTRTFTVTMPTSGQHQSYKNYGSRNYAEYIQARQVWFPFDVYMNNSWEKAGQWLTLPSGALSYTFELPVWVNEGNYDVKFRALAENSPIPPSNPNRDNPYEETNANLSVPNHIATKTIPVKVIGRLFDFKITDVSDYNWELVFRPTKGSDDILPNRSYWIGDQDFNGDKRYPTVATPFELPLGPNSSPLQGYSYNAVKTGYHFKFDLKTVGNMYGLTDGVRITPSFTFVKKDGTGREPVDLYYSTTSQPFIKIGSVDDTLQRQVILNDPLRNVTSSEFTDTATFLYDRVFNDLGRSKAGNRAAYIDNYAYKAEKPVSVGTAYSWQLLASGVRTFIGVHNNDAGDAALANASVQKWYGEYSLPAAVKVVEKNLDLAAYAGTHRLDDHSDIFKKDGFIIVTFNIESIQNGNTSAPHLQYIYGPWDNQWSMEGRRSSFTDVEGHVFQILDGDILYYHADKSSYDDLGTYVPH